MEATLNYLNFSQIHPDTVVSAFSGSSARVLKVTNTDHFVVGIMAIHVTKSHLFGEGAVVEVSDALLGKSDTSVASFPSN